mmetsp:Transcript_52435/g.124882  ORF Transcript_52435/g.124882 Transcript_52435/m.124882 type:complete len:105 (+) Transcript_52435:59-373(+)
MSVWNAPPSRAASSACEPCSTTTPASRTATRGAAAIVEALCAISSTERPFMTRSRASRTRRSLSLSSADVASSSSSTRGSRRTARAMATLCFCPPDSWLPCSPT